MKIQALIAASIALSVTLAALPARAGPLHDAAREGDSAAAAKLIAQGADVQEINDETALTPLVEAALAGHTATVVMLVENGADPAGRDGKGFTALHAAAHMGHVEIVELLIEQGVDINDQQNTSSVTPLHLAAERNYRDVAVVLLLRGATLDLKTEHGHTAVIKAVLNTHDGMVKLLRDHGADCSFRSKRFSEYCLNAGNGLEGG